MEPTGTPTDITPGKVLVSVSGPEYAGSTIFTTRTPLREAVARLYYKGLFRGHPAKPFYSSVDGVGYLLYALLQLDRVLANPKAVVGASPRANNA